MIVFETHDIDNRCAVCKRYVNRHKSDDWVRLIAEDSAKAWMCLRCFRLTLEEIFMPVGGERPRPSRVY